MPTTLIVDGDIFAYQGAAGAEEVTNWGTDDNDGCQWAVTADERVARKYMDNALEELMDNLGGDHLVVTLSDTLNWRKEVLPSYKSNRATTRKPIILPQARAYLREKYAAWQRPKLEGDDLLGILSGLNTLPGIATPGDRIMVTKDKDMSTLPGLHYRVHQTILGVFEVSLAEANLFHLRQGLAGDPTDGYAGCPGWGMKTAEEFLKEPYRLVPVEHTPTRGKSAGVPATKWVKEDHPDLWTCILSLFEQAEVTPEDALVQFQVARILRVADYDFKRKEPILWTP